MLRLALLLLGLIAPAGASAGAETRMTNAAFESWSTGQTLSYLFDGQVWGRERHLPGRAVLHANAGGPCRSGRWYPHGDDVCLVYTYSPGLQCWRFLRNVADVFAEVLNDPNGARHAVSLSDHPIPCAAPDVGL